jgi:hypothetical protein
LTIFKTYFESYASIFNVVVIFSDIFFSIRQVQKSRREAKKKEREAREAEERRLREAAERDRRHKEELEAKLEAEANLRMAHQENTVTVRKSP